MNQMICSAINSKKVLRMYYDGGYRTIEPFCHGISTAMNEVLRGYQTDGYSESGNGIGWKLMKVSDMMNVSIEKDSFEGNRPEYNPNDSAMTQIHCHI